MKQQRSKRRPAQPTEETPYEKYMRIRSQRKAHPYEPPEDEELDNPFEPRALPAQVAPTPNQTKAILGTHIILAHEQITRLDREEASAIITKLTEDVREIRGGKLVPYSEFSRLVHKILYDNYGLS